MTQTNRGKRSGKGRVGAGFAASLVLCVGTVGCHGDTNQGGGTDTGVATKPVVRQKPQSTPTPPSADRIDPNSPRAVLGGTSTTQPETSNGQAQPKPQP